MTARSSCGEPQRVASGFSNWIAATRSLSIPCCRSTIRAMSRSVSRRFKSGFASGRCRRGWRVRAAANSAARCHVRDLGRGQPEGLGAGELHHAVAGAGDQVRRDRRRRRVRRLGQLPGLGVVFAAVLFVGFFAARSTARISSHCAASSRCRSPCRRGPACSARDRGRALRPARDHLRDRQPGAQTAPPEPLRVPARRDDPARARHRRSTRSHASGGC